MSRFVRAAVNGLKAIIADDHRFKPDNFYKTEVDANGMVRFGFIKALLTRTTANWCDKKFFQSAPMVAEFNNVRGFNYIVYMENNTFIK